MKKIKPIILIILDGWGYRSIKQDNAISSAYIPQWNTWWNTYPHILLNASGCYVGLPAKQIGNSETGHLHIGSGRIVLQDISYINDSIKTSTFIKNKVLLHLINIGKIYKKTLHIMGLLSPGGVHSHENHLFKFLEMCIHHNYHDICLHIFLDGRDTPPKSALHSINKLNNVIKNSNIIIGSISGRYFAMDRDKNWDRTQKVYYLLTELKSNYMFDTAESAIKNFYSIGIYDEFIPPTLIKPGKKIEKHDSIFFFNFRSDRSIQLTQAFIDKSFCGFYRNKYLKIKKFVSMSTYSKNLNTTAVFPHPYLQNTLGEILSNYGLKQLRIAETEKYNHVTFFLNGKSEKNFINEDRILIKSKNVETYDLFPQMRSYEITNILIKSIKKNIYDIIICNYANADMVGHTGNFDATVESIECIDSCFKKINNVLKTIDVNILVTADHGNAEIMFNRDVNQIHTSHTNQLVPLLFINKNYKFIYPIGDLIDIAPTILYLLGIKKPKHMTGKSLLITN